MKNKIISITLSILIFNISVYAAENQIDPLTVLGPDIKLNKSKENNKDILLIEEKQKSIKENPIQKVYEAYQNLKENVAKGIDQFNQTASKFNLPIKANLTEDTVAKGSLKWSLVNDKCEPDPKAIFQKTIKDIRKKYKKLVKELTNPDYWKMWLLNQTIDAVVTTIAFIKCSNKIMKDPTISSSLKAKATAEVSLCVQKKLEGSVKTETSGYAGTMTGGKKGVKIDPAKIGATAICSVTIYPKVFGPIWTRCMSEEKRFIFSLFNGQINFNIKMFGINFKLAQQKCILNKYNMKIDLNKVTNEFFDLDAISDKKKSKGTITLKTPATAKPSVIINTRRSVLKKYQNSFINTFKNLNDPKYNIQDNLILSAEYTVVLFNWVNDIFNTPMKYRLVSKKPYSVNVPITGRWDFNILFGHDKKWWGASDPEHKVSIYSECRDIANSADIYDLLNYSSPTSYENGKNTSHGTGRFNLYLFLFPDMLSETKILKNLGNEENPTLRSKLYDYKLAGMMNAICLNWASNLKANYLKELEKLEQLEPIQTNITSEGRRVSENTSKLVKGLFSIYKNDLQIKIKALTDLEKSLRLNVKSYRELFDNLLEKSKKEKLKNEQINNIFFKSNLVY